MLFRNAVMWAVLFAWLFKASVGAGNIFAAYVVVVAVISAIAICVPMKPEKALHVTLLGRFWRWIEVISQWAMLAVMVWFGHFGVAIAWAIACVCLSIMRLHLKQQKRKAMEKQAKDIIESFKAFMGGAQTMPMKMETITPADVARYVQP